PDRGQQRDARREDRQGLSGDDPQTVAVGEVLARRQVDGGIWVQTGTPGGGEQGEETCEPGESPDVEGNRAALRGRNRRFDRRWCHRGVEHSQLSSWSIPVG